MKKFKGKLTGEGPNSAWTFLRIPFDAQKVFGSKARISIRGKINGFAFRSSLFPDGKGGHAMMVNKTMRAGAKAEQGQTVNMEMEVDTAPRTVAVPPDLKTAMKSNPLAEQTYKSLAPSCKKEYVEWITQAKREETRKTRVEKAVAFLAQGKKRLFD